MIGLGKKKLGVRRVGRDVSDQSVEEVLELRLDPLGEGAQRQRQHRSHQPKDGWSKERGQMC